MMFFFIFSHFLHQKRILLKKIPKFGIFPTSNGPKRKFQRFPKPNPFWHRAHMYVFQVETPHNHGQWWPLQIYHLLYCQFRGLLSKF